MLAVTCRRFRFRHTAARCPLTRRAVLSFCQGWFADWDFVDNGQNICEPDSAVLRAPRGVLRDDDIASTQSYEDGGNGYGSALDCGVRIRGGAQATVNLHIVAMNLEGDGNGICGTTIASCQGDGNQGDFLKIYDGRDATAPLLAQLTGAPTDQVTQHVCVFEPASNPREITMMTTMSIHSIRF